MPRLTLIAGRDGAGKSTLARQAGFDGPFVNADDIARAINPEASEAAAAAAGRETLAQLAALIHEGRDVVHETTRRRAMTRARPWRPKSPERRRRMFSPS